MTNLVNILTARHYVVNGKQADKTTAAYFNAYLLSNFGIVLDKPDYADHKVVEAIAKTYNLTVPASFYKNPQDTKYFTKSELFVEQLVSYFVYEMGNYDVARLEVFKKDLPEYTKGNELVLREFKVLTSDEEISTVLKDIVSAYCAYTRPFGLDELEEFTYLYDNGFYSDEYVACKDNAISMLDKSVKFARFLDKKDLVKLSVKSFGERKELDSFVAADKKSLALIKACMPLVKDCAMSKKQAKYYNKLAAMCRYDVKKATNVESPYRLAKIALDNGNILEAAKIYADNGSLLERNIKMLLSRANPFEAVEILNMLPAKNPIALYQMVSALSEDDGSARTFTFTKNNKVKKHVETEFEAKYRKSNLNDSTRKFLHDTCFDKIDSYYSSLESLGKIYLSEDFYNLGVPTNTSAGGKGIDTLPTGSRIKCPFKNIRSFVYWKNVFDIDASLTLVYANGRTEIVYFGNYAHSMSNAIRFSGDDRRSSGAEYYDLNLDLLEKAGIKQVLFHFNGFGGKLNQGEIYCGYQNKADLDTEAWDPKNIAMQIHVKGDSRAALGFAVDLATREVVVINQMLESGGRVMNPADIDVVKKVMSSSFLELNMGRILAHRGELVSSPEEADIVFDDSYKPTEGQSVVRTYELEKLVSFTNA